MENIRMSSIDSNKRAFLKACSFIQDAENIDTCLQALVGAFNNSEFDFNVLSTVYTVGINRLLDLKTAEIFHLILDAEETVEAFASKIEAIGEEVSAAVETFLHTFCSDIRLKEYLTLIYKAVIGSFTNSQLVLSGYSYDMWEREDYAYDAMFKVLQNKFTKEHHIEVPFMYIMSWAIESYFNKKHNRGHLEHCEKNINMCAKYLGDVLSGIVLGHIELNDGLMILAASEAEYEQYKQSDKHMISVDFRNLLPNINYIDKRINAKDAIERKRLLATVPMVPCSRHDLDRDALTFLFELVKKNIELEDQNRELTITNEKLVKITKKNNMMVDDFSHSYSNIIKPDLVFHVAKSIMKDLKFKNEYQDLIRAYNNEIIARNECEILKLTHTDDSEKSKIAAQNYIRQGIACGEGVDINYLINYSLERTLMRVLFENKERTKSIRDELSKTGANIEELIYSFKNSVLSKPTNDSSALEWFNNIQGAFKINISIDENWKGLNLAENESAATFVITRFMELFFNAFTYCRKGTESYLNVKLYTEKVDISDYLVINFQNPTDNNSKTFRGSNRGISATEEILNILNYDKYALDQKFVHITSDNPNEYNIRLFINKDLLIKE